MGALIFAVLLALWLGVSPTMLLLFLWLAVIFVAMVFAQELLSDWWRK